MITICACPKPFEGHIGEIQEEAIRSWKEHVNTEIVLLGDEKGTKETAKKYGCIYCPDILANSTGIPLLSSIFEKINEVANGDVIVYVSADVKLYINAHHFALPKYFLGVGYRHDENWNTKQLIKHGPSANDYWIFPKGMYNKFPPFTVGRGAQEGWMIWHAQKYGIPVIDFSNHIMAIHQNHGYGHIPEGHWDQTKEYEKNIKIAGGFWHLRTLRDVKLQIINGEIKETPLTIYELFIDNPIGQWLLGLKRWLIYQFHLL